MTREGKFGPQEAISMLVITIASKAFLTSPAMVTKLVGTAGWYMTIISAMTATIGFTFLFLLLKRFPGKSIMEIYDSVLGKFLGFFFSLVLAAFLMLNAMVDLREFAEVMKAYVYPLSPISYVTGLFLLVAVCLSFLGLEGIARYSKYISWILILGFSAVLIMSVQNYQIHRLFPIFGHGIGKTIANGLPRCSVYGEIILIGIFASSLQGIKYIKKAGYISIILACCVISGSLVAFNLTFPYYTGQEITAPMYEMVSLINYGEFFQRIEPIFLIVWNISSLIAATVLFYTAIMVYCHIFGIRDKRPVIIPFAIILFSLSMIPKGMTFLMDNYVQGLREYGWMAFFLPPLIALSMAILRKKGGDRKKCLK